MGVWRNHSSYFSGALQLLAVILLADSLIDQVAQIHGHSKSALLSGLFIFVPATFVLLTVIVFLKGEHRPWMSRIPLALIVIASLGRIAWVLYFDSYQNNDFGYYLRCAEDFVRTGNPADSDYCMPVYWKRAAFYTYPIVALFGTSLLAIKLVNVGLLTLASWFFFKSAEMILGLQKAAIALSLFIWQPDLWYAATLASHDVPGIFWLSVFFYLAGLIHVRLRPMVLNWKALTFLSVCLGVTLFFLDVSRSYHYGAMVAWILYIAVRSILILARAEDCEHHGSWFREMSSPADPGTLQPWQRVRIQFLLLLMLPLAIYQVGIRAFWSRWDFSGYAEEKSVTCFISAIDVTGITEWSQTNNWQDRQCPLIPPEVRQIFALRKVLQDITINPLQYLRHLERKNRILGRVDDYILAWATWPQPDPWDHSSGQVKRLNNRHVGEQAAAASMLQFLLLLLVIWRLVVLARLPFRLMEMLWISFSLTYYLMFLLLAEGQGRYDLFLIFPFACMSAHSIEDIWHRVARTKTHIQFHLKACLQMCMRGGIVLLILLAVFWGASRLISGSSLTLRDQSGFEQIPEGQLPLLSSQYSQIPPRFMVNNHKQLMLGYRPGSGVAADRILAVRKTFPLQNRPNHHLRFFISTYAVTQGDFELSVPWNFEDFEFTLLINGTQVDTGSLSEIQDNRYYSFEPGRIRFSSPMMISLIIRNRKRLDPVTANRCPVIGLELIDLQ